MGSLPITGQWSYFSVSALKQELRARFGRVQETEVAQTPFAEQKMMVEFFPEHCVSRKNLVKRVLTSPETSMSAFGWI